MSTPPTTTLARILLLLLAGSCAAAPPGPASPAADASAASPLDTARALYKAGRYAETEPFLRADLARAERSAGPDHPDVAAALNNLGVLYMALNRYPEAEALYQRALAIREQALGPEDLAVASSLSELGVLYVAQARYADAEPLYQRALAIREAELGPVDPRVAQSLSNLGVLHEAQAHPDRAEPLYERAIEIQERSLGPDHPDLAASLNNLGVLRVRADRLADAEPLYRRALTIHEKVLHPEHPKVAASLNNLAVLHEREGRLGEALEAIRRAARIQRGRVVRDARLPTPGATSERLTRGLVFPRHVEIGRRLALDAAPGERARLVDETFQAAQVARATDTAAALERVAARFAAGDSELSRLIREQQDAAERWQTFDLALIEAVSRPPADRDAEREEALRQELAALGLRLEEQGREMAARFPEYAELTSPEPASIAEVQPLLAADEALLAYYELPDGGGTCLWVVRRDRAEVRRLDLAEGELEAAVRGLRAQLDPGQMAGTLARFDVAAAHALYRKVVPAEAAALLEGARELLIVPHGPLESLPFAVLVRTPPPPAATGARPAYREVDWLARHHATTTLPSVTSLRALRRVAKPSLAAEAFRGVGDPLLAGHPDLARAPAGTAAVATRAAAAREPAAASRVPARAPLATTVTSLLATRTLADPARVRELPALPETADELRDFARVLGATDASLLLRDAATERQVKSAGLARARVIAFATHAGVAGEIEGVSEPALVLTPPEVASEEDDGLLTASEAAQLDLDAEFVLLSACNTAAPDGTPGASGLSGLAKAFIYAGSRSLLVSHWQVLSDASAALTTGMFAELGREPTLGRAEALRRSMLRLLDGRGPAYFAHPAAWAPFVVVGQGGPLSRPPAQATASAAGSEAR